MSGLLVSSYKVTPSSILGHRKMLFMTVEGQNLLCIFCHGVMTHCSRLWGVVSEEQMEKGSGRVTHIRRAHNLKCHIFKLLNNFFLDIFSQFSGPFYISFF